MDNVNITNNMMRNCVVATLSKMKNYYFDEQVAIEDVYKRKGNGMKKCFENNIIFLESLVCVVNKYGHNVSKDILKSMPEIVDNTMEMVVFIEKETILNTQTEIHDLHRRLINVLMDLDDIINNVDNLNTI